MEAALEHLGMGSLAGKSVVLQGIGHGMPSLVITSVRVLIVAVPLAYSMVLLLDAPIEAVWTSALFGGLCSNILAFWWVRRLVWVADPTARATTE